MAGFRRLLDEPDSSASQGSVPYWDSAGDIARLAPGSSGDVLTSQGAAADPIFAAPSSALDIDGLTAGNITVPYTDTVPVYVASVGANRKWTPDMFVPRGYHFGLTLSNGAGDPTNDITIAAGIARDASDTTTLRLTGPITKRLDAAWAVGDNNGGLDTGSIANDVYHMWLIMRSDTGVVDVLFSNSATSPTLPASYDYKRRIGAIIRASGAILLFTQVSHHFVLSANVLDANVTNLGASRTLYTITVPDGVKVWADVRIICPTATESVYATSPDQADESVSSANGRVTVQGGTGESQERMVRTNTSGQIGLRGNGANTDARIGTYGWWDWMED